MNAYRRPTWLKRCGAIAAVLVLTIPGAKAAGDHREAGYYVSVEIPIEKHVYPAGGALRLDRLVDRRTGFDSDHFHLRELVLIARSNVEDTTARAELKMHGEMSDAIDIPLGTEEEWWEVRIPAPSERHGGVWRLYLTGDIALDQVVAVMEPRERYAARYTEPVKTHRVASRTYYPPTYTTYDYGYGHYGSSSRYVGHLGYRSYPYYTSPWIRRYDPLVSVHYYTVFPGWHGFWPHTYRYRHDYRLRPLRRHHDYRPRFGPRRHIAGLNRRAPLRVHGDARRPGPVARLERGVRREDAVRTFSRGPDTRQPPPRPRQSGERVQPERIAAARDRLESLPRLSPRGPAARQADRPRTAAPARNRPAATTPARTTRSTATPARRTEMWHGSQPRSTGGVTAPPRPAAAPDRLRGMRSDLTQRHRPTAAPPRVPQTRASSRPTQVRSPQTRPQMRAPQQRTQQTRAPARQMQPRAFQQRMAPSRPTQTRAPSRPMQTRAPSRPMQARAPSRPMQARAPSRPMRAQAPQRPQARAPRQQTTRSMNTRREPARTAPRQQSTLRGTNERMRNMRR